MLSVEQVDEAIRVARGMFGPGFAAFIATAAYVGMLPGELYALRWPMIDFAQDEISVVASYSTLSGETTPPKNDHHRLIVLFPEAKRALLEVPRHEGTIVFRTVRGRPLTGKTLHYYWDPVRTAIGKPGMDFYELRHFCCAHLNTLGHEAEDVAYQVGHTDGGVLIRKLYGHPSESLARQRLKANFGRKVVPLRSVSGANGGQHRA
ncbi:MAG: tyrosine-type recombinase/integrase [Solirubrobacteraceae bacterium]